MTRRPRSKTQLAIEAIEARLARGELTAAQAAEQIAVVRRAHYEAVYRALLDSAAQDDELAAVPAGGFGQVAVRLSGAHRDVGGALALLQQVTEVQELSAPFLHEDGVRVYARISRRTPLSGGVK